MLRSVDIDLLAEPRAAELAQRERARNKSFRYHRTCVMAAWRREQGFGIPSYCLQEFDTNYSSKITCSFGCAEDRRRINKKRS